MSRTYVPLDLCACVSLGDSEVHQSCLDNFDPISVRFFAIGAYAAFQTARKAAA
ncbi:hypothetical protein ACH4U5_18740 [Streptomyces sp. NPDC020858]|uniref:hypothetical protein n=1 Tax=Streptomyces sp. NPDC020858 TaxID=3365097 RepID=UPI0037AC9CEC